MDSTSLATESATVGEVLMWVLVALLAMLLVGLVAKLITNMKGDNQIYYEEKGAINLRINKLPDFRIATKNCNDFKLVAQDKKIIISYANPFGQVKEFECAIVGNPIKKPFQLNFTETEFKKLCFHLRPGKISVLKNKLVFNYGSTVKVKFEYL